VRELESLRGFVYRLRCKFGAWLLREHIGALAEHYSMVGEMAKIKGESERKQRVDYIRIGLTYAKGQSTQWRRFDDVGQRQMREALYVLELARDGL